MSGNEDAGTTAVPEGEGPQAGEQSASHAQEGEAALPIAPLEELSHATVAETTVSPALPKRSLPSLAAPWGVGGVGGTPLLVYVAVAVLAAVGIGIGAVLFLKGTEPVPQAASRVTSPPVPVEGGGQSVTVPDVIGMGEEEAVEVLLGAGLTNVVVEYSLDPNSFGKVFIQSTPGGENARLDEQVTISVGGLEDFTGMTLQQALEQAEVSGYFFTIVPATDDTGDAGTVVGQEPVPGSPVTAGGEVTLTALTGANSYTPKLIGLTEEEATVLLLKTGLTVGDITYLIDPQAYGTVTGLSAKYLEVLKKGTAVDLQISAVPDLTGMDIADAIDLIAFNGLELGEVTVTRPESGEKPRLVVTQSPAGGTAARVREPINLTVPLLNESVVPGLQGMPESEALEALRKAGLAVGQISGPRDGGRVASQSVDPRIVVPSGTRVDLVFQDVEVEVPDVIGFPEATAVAQLERGGFTVLVRPKQGVAGIVVEQTPRGGSVPEGAREVTIFVGRG